MTTVGVAFIVPSVQTVYETAEVVVANTGRVRALITELDKLAKEYVAARDEFEASRQVFEAAKEKLVAVRKVAPEVLGLDWHGWVNRHPEVKLVGLDVGSAILAVLESKAYRSAVERVRSLQDPNAEEKTYDPSLQPSEITDALDAQGFEFRTGTPRREVHAALLNLKGIMKVERPWGQEYQVEKHAEIYRSMRQAYDLPPDEEGNLVEEPDQQEDAATVPDDDVPF